MLNNFKFKSELIGGDYDQHIKQIDYNIPWGLISKHGYKLIREEVRRLYEPYRPGGCGHDWDCCGCVTSVTHDISYHKDGIRIIETTNFNY